MQRFISPLALALALATTQSLAAPLGTGFTYQGELQVSGTPANGAFDFEFTLFDATTDGTELGATIDVQDVTVTDGIFSVELDFDATPFAGDQLWIDIAVRNGTSNGGYTGLLPRQKLTATPYALHAEMVAANAISGAEIANNSIAAADIAANAVGASELAANSVAASEIAANAVGQSEINSAQVQERVSGTCAAGSFATGVNQDGSLNCLAGGGDYTDADAVAAILAADGPGSGLNADLIDGQQASEIIAQASQPVGTEITSLPFTIDTSGTYFITQNLSIGSGSTAILISAEGVTLNLLGNTIAYTGAGGGTAGIRISAPNVLIRNGSITGFPNAAIQSSGTAVTHVRVEHMLLSENEIALALPSGTNYVHRTTAHNNDNEVRLRGFMTESLLSGNGGSSQVRIESGGIARSIIVPDGTFPGIRCSGATVKSNNIVGGVDGISAANCLVVGNTLTEQTGQALRLSKNSRAMNNQIVSENVVDHAVSVDDQTVFVDNSVNCETGITCATAIEISGSSMVEANHLARFTTGLLFSANGVSGLHLNNRYNDVDNPVLNAGSLVVNGGGNLCYAGSGTCP